MNCPNLNVVTTSASWVCQGNKGHRLEIRRYGGTAENVSPASQKEETFRNVIIMSRRTSKGEMRNHIKKNNHEKSQKCIVYFKK